MLIALGCAAPKHPTWEYRVAVPYVPQGDDTWTRAINREATNGWEMVSCQLLPESERGSEHRLWLVLRRSR
jgi:hypothetical protein